VKEVESPGYGVLLGRGMLFIGARETFLIRFKNFKFGPLPLGVPINLCRFLRIEFNKQ
jgi:hypothetical protein